jgi:hypothetical protein
LPLWGEFELTALVGIAIALFVVAVGVPLIRLMLQAVAGRDGQRAGDAGDYALQVVAQGEAFRVDDSKRRVPWDGIPRLTGVEGNDSGG